MPGFIFPFVVGRWLLIQTYMNKMFVSATDKRFFADHKQVWISSTRVQSTAYTVQLQV